MTSVSPLCSGLVYSFISSLLLLSSTPSQRPPAVTRRIVSQSSGRSTTSIAPPPGASLRTLVPSLFFPLSGLLSEALECAFYGPPNGPSEVLSFYLPYPSVEWVGRGSGTCPVLWTADIAPISSRYRSARIAPLPARLRLPYRHG